MSFSSYDHNVISSYDHDQGDLAPLCPILASGLLATRVPPLAYQVHHYYHPIKILKWRSIKNCFFMDFSETGWFLRNPKCPH